MRHVTHHRALALMVLCLLVAAALRLPDLSTIPPGPHYDEAANVILAGDIAFRQYRPVFISSYTGKETLFFYLAAGVMRAVGESTWALRLTAAFAGLLTVAATYWLGVELFRDRRVALLAAALLAFSFWHLLFSRLGFRAITEPFLQALAVAALLRGLRLNSWPWLAVAGATLGLAGYTYLAVRLFPLLLLLALLPVLIRRPLPGQRWSQLALVGGVALAVLAPLLIFFMNHPHTFWVRITQVAPGQEGLSLGESYLRSLYMFFVAGDPYIRFNIPQRPLFDWFWSGLLLAGWLSLLWRWPRLRHEWQQSGALLLLLAPFIMILPTALATNEIVPSNLRAIGLMPFIFYLPAMGAVVLAKFLASYANLKRLAWVAGGLALLITLAITTRAYFHTWATTPALYYESDADLAAAAQFLDEMETGGGRIYMAARHYQHPTVAALSRQYDQVLWLPNSQALPLPPDTPAIYVFPRSAPLPAWATPYLQTAVRLNTPDGPDNTPAFTAYALAAPPDLNIPYPATANFGHVITLLGFDAAGAHAGREINLTLFWRIEARPPADFTPFVHLEDAWGHRWSQVETFAYPTAQWQPGEQVVQQVIVPVPAGAPPGTYRLRVGLFNQVTGERLPRLDEDGRYAGDAFIIEGAPILAGPPPDPLPWPPHVIDQQILPHLRLLGYQRGGPEIAAGEQLSLALWWYASAPLPALHTRLELLRTDQIGGRIVTTTQPVHGAYPFISWQTPQFLIDHLAPRLPHNLPPGNYEMQIRILNANDDTLFTAGLGPLTVVATDRLFAPPPVEHRLAASFGNEIDLLGYNLQPLAEGHYRLQLIWQATAVPATAYTVFIHVLTPEGVCCVWQQDIMPRQGQYPTDRWLPGEVIVDAYQIELPDDLPPGSYPLEVGLYLAETGQRLQVVAPGQAPTDVIFLRPLLITSDS